MKRGLLLGVLVLLGLFGSVHAQTTPSSPAKRDLVARILTVQQPAIENMAQSLTVQPAAQLMQQASVVLQTRVVPEKRDALGKEIQGDLKKYLDEAVPLVRDRALKLAPGTIGALLEEKFTEDELKQLVNSLEAPAFRKFQSLGGEMEKALVEKLLADARGQIDTKLRVLNQAVAKRLGIQPRPTDAAAAPDKAKPPAKAASK